jgi:transcriptional antiterminator RfaH
MPLDQPISHGVSIPPHQGRVGHIPVRCGGYSPRWSVVCTHPKAEAWADANITDAGYVSFLPMIAAATRNRRGQREIGNRPLFAGYLFVQLDLATDPWIAITHLPGVRGFIANALRPAQCPVGAVEALVAGDAQRRTQTPCAGLLRAMDACSVTAGPFCGHTGQVVGVNGDRAVVAVMLFGRLQNLHFDTADLVPAADFPQ